MIQEGKRGGYSPEGEALAPPDATLGMPVALPEPLPIPLPAGLLEAPEADDVGPTRALGPLTSDPATELVTEPVTDPVTELVTEEVPSKEEVEETVGERGTWGDSARGDMPLVGEGPAPLLADPPPPPEPAPVAVPLPTLMPVPVPVALLRREED